MRHLWVVAIVVFSAPGLAAQGATDTIATDRPDFTESSALVSAGRVQLEAGLTFTGTSRTDGGGTSRSWPELLLRYGLTSRLELRVGQSLATLSSATDVDSGFTELEDLYLGMKVGLGAQQGMRPELALLVQTTIPTGGDQLSAESVLPGAALLAGWELSERYSLAAGLQANRLPGNGFGLAPSVTVGRAFSPRVKAYAELYSFLPVADESGDRSAHYANGGVAVLLSPTIQFDARIGAGFSQTADRYFVGFGFAIRR